MFCQTGISGELSVRRVGWSSRSKTGGWGRRTSHIPVTGSLLSMRWSLHYNLEQRIKKFASPFLCSYMYLQCTEPANCNTKKFHIPTWYLKYQPLPGDFEVDSKNMYATSIEVVMAIVGLFEPSPVNLASILLLSALSESYIVTESPSDRRMSLACMWNLTKTNRCTCEWLYA